MNAWIEARQAALAEAREEGTEISHNNDDFMEIFRKHTEGLEGFRSRL
jgi:hypothetical protein